jgi:hypothetical protein
VAEVHPLTPKGPIWNGEFGPVYDDATDGPEWEKTNESRYGVLECQLDIYQRSRASWSIWLYKGEWSSGRVIGSWATGSLFRLFSGRLGVQWTCRRRVARLSLTRADIGFQGMVYVDPETPYMKLLEPFLKKKKASVSFPSHIPTLLRPPPTTTLRRDTLPRHSNLNFPDTAAGTRRRCLGLQRPPRPGSLRAHDGLAVRERAFGQPALPSHVARKEAPQPYCAEHPPVCESGSITAYRRRVTMSNRHECSTPSLEIDD